MSKRSWKNYIGPGIILALVALTVLAFAYPSVVGHAVAGVAVCLVLLGLLAVAVVVVDYRDEIKNTLAEFGYKALVVTVGGYHIILDWIRRKLTGGK